MTTKESPKFYLISAIDFVFANSRLQLFLYPGVSAAVSQEQLDLLSGDSQSLLKINPIDKDTFESLIKNQSVLGQSVIPGNKKTS
jgi:hypothetical protein